MPASAGHVVGGARAADPVTGSTPGRSCSAAARSGSRMSAAPAHLPERARCRRRPHGAARADALPRRRARGARGVRPRADAQPSRLMTSNVGTFAASAATAVALAQSVPRPPGAAIARPTRSGVAGRESCTTRHCRVSGGCECCSPAPFAASEPSAARERSARRSANRGGDRNLARSSPSCGRRARRARAAPALERCSSAGASRRPGDRVSEIELFAEPGASASSRSWRRRSTASCRRR